MRRRSRGMATIAIKHDLLTYGDRHNCGGLGAHQQFIRLCHVEDGGVAVNFSGILNGVEIRDGCPIVAIPGLRGYIIEQSMVLGIFEDKYRKSVVFGKSASVSVDLGGGRMSYKKNI